MRKLKAACREIADCFAMDHPRAERLPRYGVQVTPVAVNPDNVDS